MIIREVGVERSRVQTNAPNLRINQASLWVLLGCGGKWVVKLATRWSRDDDSLCLPFVDLGIHKVLEGMRYAVLPDKLGLLGRYREPNLGVGDRT